MGELSRPGGARHHHSRFVEELSYEELAMTLAIPIGTVKWRIFNAKKKLPRLSKLRCPRQRGDSASLG